MLGLFPRGLRGQEAKALISRGAPHPFARFAAETKRIHQETTSPRFPQSFLNRERENGIHAALEDHSQMSRVGVAGLGPFVCALYGLREHWQNRNAAFGTRGGAGITVKNGHGWRPISLSSFTDYLVSQTLCKKLGVPSCLQTCLLFLCPQHIHCV